MPGAAPGARRVHTLTRPRRLIRPLRWLLLLLLAAAFWYASDRYTLLRLPDSAAVLFDFTPGQRVVVIRGERDRPARIGDAVLFRGRGNELRLGRLVAIGAEPLVVELDRQRLRRDGETTWYPAARELLARLPAAPGQILVLAENSAFRGLGDLVGRERIVGRVIVGLPF